jgi:hypothetical protein
MKTLLVCAHPGHELRLHHWMEQSRPDVFFITDGSGSAGVPRLQSSLAVINRAGSRMLAGSGSLPDRRLYEAMRGRDIGLFQALKEQIAALVRAGGYDELVCDGLEGFNTAHDWCHYLVQSVARPLRVSVLEHSLVNAPDAWAGPGSRILCLDDEALDRKLRAAAAYPEMAVEVEETLRRWGRGRLQRRSASPGALERAAADPGGTTAVLRGLRRTAGA